MESPSLEMAPDAKRFKSDMEWELQCSAVFGNHLILSEIFSHVSNATDLKNIRLVSKLWRDISLDQWRRRGTVRLLWRKEAFRPCIHCESTKSSIPITDDSSAMEISDYLSLLETSKLEGASCPYQLWKKPFARFSIGHCSILKPNNWEDENLGIWAINNNPPIWEDPILEKLWNECGVHMKYLKFDHLTVFNAKYFEAFRWILSERLPNLRELSMLIVPTKRRIFFYGDGNGLRWLEGYEKVGFSEDGPANKLTGIQVGLCQNAEREAVQQVGQHISSLMQHLPNVNNLKVDSMAYNFLQSLQNPSSSGKPIQLKSLTLPVQASTKLDVYRFLQNYMNAAKPPLKTLKIGVDLHRAGSRSSFHGFLRSCQKSLHHLELESHPMAIRGKSLSNQLANLNFPHLTKLYLYAESMISFSALKGLPNLTTLWVQTDNCKYDWNKRLEKEVEEEEATGSTLHWGKMTQLHMDYFRFTPNSLRILGRWMQNIERIELILHESTRGVVHEIWPDLGELTELRKR